MKWSILRKVQNSMRGGPVGDYLIISLALSLGASYFVVEGCTLSMIIAKTLIAFIIISLWGLMVYTFMQTPFRLVKCVFAAAITFVAQSNIVIALTMDIKNFAITVEILSIVFIISCVIAGAMAEIKHISDVHNGKSKST